jgi:hypothetical protein
MGNTDKNDVEDEEEVEEEEDNSICSRSIITAVLVVPTAVQA